MVSPLHYRPSTYWTTRMTTTMIMTTETKMMMMFLLQFIRVSLNIEITMSHSWNAPSLKFKFSTLSYFFNFNILQKSNGLVSSQYPNLFRNIGSLEVPWPKINRSFKQTGWWWLTMVMVMAKSKYIFQPNTRLNWASQFSNKVQQCRSLFKCCHQLVQLSSTIQHKNTRSWLQLWILQYYPSSRMAILRS